MSWTFNLANWQFELDWRGLTVTPLVPQTDAQREAVPEITARQVELGQAPALDEGKTQVWV